MTSSNLELFGGGGGGEFDSKTSILLFDIPITHPFLAPLHHSSLRLIIKKINALPIPPNIHPHTLHTQQHDHPSEPITLHPSHQTNLRSQSFYAHDPIPRSTISLR